MIALLDCDLIAFRTAASVENESLEIGIYRVNDLYSRILQATKAVDHQGYISGGDNFRYKIDPTYKGNRVDKERPKFLEPLREHLVTEWGVKVTDGIEADDAIGIDSKKYWDLGLSFVVVSLDKDLEQLPGKHYCWEFAGKSYGKEWVRPERHFFVSPLDGMKFFYRQLLIGDNADNVKGVKQIGPVKAAAIIDHLETEQGMFEAVQSLYNDDERLLRNGRLLWLLRTEDDEWNFPKS